MRHLLLPSFLILLTIAACAPVVEPTHTPVVTLVDSQETPVVPTVEVSPEAPSALDVVFVSKEAGPPAPPMTPLLRLLQAVPSDLSIYVETPQLSNLTIWYLDRAGEFAGAGVPLPRSEEERIATFEQRLIAASGVYTPVQTGVVLREVTLDWEETFGYSPYAYERVLSVTEGLPSPPFGAVIVEGLYETERIKERLRALDYTEDESGLFALPFSQRAILQDSPIIDATGPTSAMNRVAPVDGRIVAGNTESLVQEIRGRLERGDDKGSLADDPVVAGLLEALGTVHWALLLPEGLLLEHQARSSYVAFDPPPDWETLHTYDWAGLGYEPQTSTEARFTVVLAYSDPEAAAADAEAFLHRFLTYRPFGPFTRQSQPGQSPGREGTPPGVSCPPHVMEIRRGDWGSVLSLSCTYDPIETSHWWDLSLWAGWDMDYLLPDLGGR